MGTLMNNKWARFMQTVLKYRQQKLSLLNSKNRKENRRESTELSNCKMS